MYRFMVVTTLIAAAFTFIVLKEMDKEFPRQYREAVAIIGE